MVAFSIYSETGVEKFQELVSSIYRYDVPLSKASRFPAEENWSSFVLSSSIRYMPHSGYPDYNPKSRFAIDVYDSAKSEHTGLGNDLRLKLQQLWDQLERPVALKNPHWDTPVFLNDL